MSATDHIDHILQTVMPLLRVKLASRRQPEDSKNIKRTNDLGTQREKLAKEKFMPFVLGAQCPLMSSVDIDKVLIKIDLSRRTTQVAPRWWTVCPMAA